MMDAATKALADILADWRVRYRDARPNAEEIVAALAVRGFSVSAAAVDGAEHLDLHDSIGRAAWYAGRDKVLHLLRNTTPDIRDAMCDQPNLHAVLRGVADVIERDTNGTAPPAAAVDGAEPVAWAVSFDPLPSEASLLFDKEAARLWGGEGRVITPLYATPPAAAVDETAVTVDAQMLDRLILDLREHAAGYRNAAQRIYDGGPVPPSTYHGGYLEGVAHAIERIHAASSSAVPAPAVDRCPKCGHAPHGDYCLNMASDNDCACTTNTVTPSAAAPAETACEHDETPSGCDCSACAEHL